MKKLLYILAIITLFNSCSKDDPIITPEENLIEGGTVTRFQMAIVKLENLDQEKYQGNINGQAIELFKVDENLTFFVKETIELGKIILEIPTLHKKIKFEIKNVVLENTVEITLNNVSQIFEGYLTNSQNPTSQELYLKNAIEKFNTSLKQLNDIEREKMAQVYQANKTYFDNIISRDFTIPQSKSFNSKSLLPDYSNLSTEALILNYKIAVFATAASGVSTYAHPLFIIPALISFKICLDLQDEALSRDVIFPKLKFDSLFSSKSNKVLTGLEFTDGVKKSIKFELSARSINNTDSNSTNSQLNIFFTTFNKFNTVIDLINNAILVANKIPLINFELLDNVSIGSSNANTISSNANFYSNLSISLNHPNLNLGNISYNNGNIDITINIIDSNNVNANIETDLNFIFKDDINNIQGSFPIVINKTNPFIGNWKAISWNGIALGTYETLYLSNCGVTHKTRTFKSGSGSFTENSINFSMNGDFYGHSNTTDCNLIENTFLGVINASINQNYTYSGIDQIATVQNLSTSSVSINVVLEMISSNLLSYKYEDIEVIFERQ